MKKFLKWIIGTSLVLILALGFVGNYFFNFALNNEVPKTHVNGQDDDGIKDPRKEINIKWFEDNKNSIDMISDVTGHKLVGYEIKNDKSDKWIIVVHGFSESAKGVATFAKGFYDRGYNVFLPDLNAHGQSEGKYLTMGGFDGKDLKQWVELISKKYNNPDIILFGVSMGASTVMNSLDENLPSNVKGFIEDSGYLSLNEEFSGQLKKLFKLPSFPIIPAASVVTKIRAGYFLGDVNATKALKETKLPALVMHGEDDTFVPVIHGQKIYDLISSPKELHIFKGAKHVKAEKLYTDEYWGYVDNFLNKYFK
ncbi:alpha/beta fold hydrolase [Pseudostreptobacillus hongkongensis]|uniref:alpha/beta hydrolase n=1 Tax=Pseudostreptobacillus hongkongensis TaxID=1162717 RepID=UPI0028D8AF43|nr:alpha/beta fold hydrolase [Pseudostreptobacillus hongkongensis]